MNKQQLISEIVDYVSDYRNTPASDFKKDFEDFLNPRVEAYMSDAEIYPIDEFNVSKEIWKEFISKK